MKIQSGENFSGIVFEDTQRAFSALVLYLMDFRKNAKFEGPEELAEFLDNPEKLLQNEMLRLRGFLGDLGKYGNAHRDYGQHIFSRLSDMSLSISPISPRILTHEDLSYLDKSERDSMIDWSRKEAAEYAQNSVISGTILKVTPHLEASTMYEDSIVEILNSLTGKLAEHFGDRKYQRILKGTSLDMQGTEKENMEVAEIMKDHFKIIGMDLGYCIEFQGRYNHVPGSDGRNLPARTWHVDLTGSSYKKENMTHLSFSHPQAIRGLHYHDYRVLRGARDQFRTSLEAKLGQRMLIQP